MGSNYVYHACRAMLLLLCVALAMDLITGIAAQDRQKCWQRSSPCFRRVIKCPMECPFVRPYDPSAKRCSVDCSSPTCEAVCKGGKNNCHGRGSGCRDPRFIGGDGIVFYFRGKRDEHFSLVSDRTIQINARFIGHRPDGRTHDFTWIQALGFMLASQTFTVEATPANQWNDTIDHLSFLYDGEPLLVPEGHLSKWKSPNGKLTVERIGSRNSARITVEGIAEVSLTAVPVTEEDDKIHNYKLPSNDCYSHLDVQFTFFRLSPQVEGVLGRTYRSDYENTAKSGVGMPVVGGEDQYRTSSLLLPDCMRCMFSPVEDNYLLE